MTTKQKLLKLADFLEHKVKDHWFGMREWGTIGFTEKKCGTTACAAGWATVCFPESGLYLYEDTYRGSDGSEDGLGISYTGLKHFEAVKAFFETDEETTNYLFNPVAYPINRRGRRSVIRRLRTTANEM